MKQQAVFSNEKTIPFQNAEEAWFWFIKALAARNEGAVSRAGLTDLPRPCEPSDILNIVDRLYQKRILLIDHLRVLIHYGERLFPPNPRRTKEAKSYMIWVEGMMQLEPVLRSKGIVA